MGFWTDHIYFRNKCHLVYFDLFCFEISYLVTYPCLFVNLLICLFADEYNVVNLSML